MSTKKKKVSVDIAEDAVEPDAIEVEEEAAAEAASGSDAADEHEGEKAEEAAKAAEKDTEEEKPADDKKPVEDEEKPVEDDLAAARAKAIELADRYARLQAEWDNFRKRNAAERADERNRANERLVSDLLPVMDDFERAIDHANGDGADLASLLEGIEAVHTKLLDVLKKHQVTQIDPIGQPFDALSHQAVSKVDDDSVPDETISQVFQKGYEMAGKTIRPAMVAVSCGGPARSAEKPEDEKGSDAGKKDKK